MSSTLATFYSYLPNSILRFTSFVYQTTDILVTYLHNCIITILLIIITKQTQERRTTMSKVIKFTPSRFWFNIQLVYRVTTLVTFITILLQSSTSNQRNRLLLNWIHTITPNLVIYMSWRDSNILHYITWR